MTHQKVLGINEIVPYANNPRRITDEAVAKVRDSIERYGYVNPIIVDEDNVIVVGHTRYRALCELGWTSVPVLVTDLPLEKRRAYRLVDNKTSEMSGWEQSALIVELREWEEELLESYFPEMDLEVALVEGTQVTQGDVDYAEKKVTDVIDTSSLLLTNVECPACYRMFKVKTATLPGLTRVDIAELSGGGGAK